MKLAAFLLLLIFPLSVFSKNIAPPSPCPPQKNGPNHNIQNLNDFDVVIFGETHGNTQSPKEFLDFVCRNLSNHHPILIGLELPEASIGAVRNNNNNGKSLSLDLFWSKSRDGRSSVAYLRMIERLISLEKEGYLHLFGFDERITGRENFAEMSWSALSNFAAKKSLSEAKWLILTGNGHARPETGSLSVSRALSEHNRRTLVINLEFSGGTSWVCSNGKCGVINYDQRTCGTSDSANVFSDGGLTISQRSICIGFITASPPASSNL